MTSQDEIRVLQRIAQAVERIGPAPVPENEIKSSNVYVWHAEKKALLPVAHPHLIDIKWLVGIDKARDTLLANTLQFAKGYSGNNVLLWGARGMGKSALIKAVHQQINRQIPNSLVLVEIRCEDIHTLPELVETLRGWVIRQFIIFCDDLSFDNPTMGSLKTTLEGGIQAMPDHILFYATSNRHRTVVNLEPAPDHKHASDIVEEETALFDRFGICLGFTPCSLETYMAIVEMYATQWRLGIAPEDLRQQAFQWMNARGASSGRVARQFVYDLAGKMGKKITS